MSKLFKFFAKVKRLTLSKLVYVLSASLSIFIATQVYAASPEIKAVWYRYYDKNGVANISGSVTPAHISHGYEALDRNMQVIKKSRAYNVENDLKQSSARAHQSRQKEQDLRLKKAYGSSQVAINKRDELLKNLNKQMTLQQQQLKQVQKDRILFKRQEMEYFRKAKDVPNDLKDRLNYNLQNINNIKRTIVTLQTDYRNTQTQYDTIIKRLKAYEK